MSTPKKTIKIFVSSPSDVPDERVVAKRVINTLASQYAYFANIESVLSEEKALPAIETPQSNIPEPSSTDIVIVLLWSRLGTPIHDPRYREHPDGPPMTGTEWEFFNAATSFNKSGRPFLLAYRKSARVFIDRDDDAEIERGREQRRMLETFERRWFRDGEGPWKGYYYSFDTIEQFEGLLDEHLRERLNIELADTTRSDDPIAPRHWPGSPFRGLAAFDVADTLIFCGRAKALADLRAKLREEIVRGVAFVLVAGASGAGKSSLVRAGLVASLLDDPALVADNGLVRYAIVRPSVATRNVGQVLRLSVSQALPELQTLGLDRDPLAAPERLESAIEEALTRAERGASLPPHLRARLVLVVDQLEELFTAVARDEANRFVDLIDRLARSGRVWVVTTLRGDYFSHLDDFPKLSKLAETGLFRLAGPQPPEVAQMIRRPAAIGGIRFERHPDTDVPLDSLILGEAAGDPASLPLLEFILDELWHRRSPDGLITYKEYEGLGGLSGGIAHRAEDVVADLEKSEAPEVGTSVDAVLESLVTVAAPSAEATAARVSQSAVANTPERARVVDRLIQERLVMIDTAPGEAEPMVRIAHERLIEHWPRLSRIVAEGRRFLAIRARLKSDAEAWIQAGEVDDLLISSARRLEDGRELLKTKRDRLDPATQRFIENSLVAADARRARESEREQERLQLELQQQQAVNALQAAALKTWRLKLAAVSAVFLLLLAGGALWVVRGQAHQERLKFRAEDLVWRVDALLSEVANATKKNAQSKIQRVAAQAEQAFNELVQSAPDNIDVRRSQASVWETIGDKFKRYANDSEAALSAYLKAQDVRRRLVDKNIEGQQDSARRQLVVNLQRVGNTLAAMRPTDALAAYEEALANAQKLADSQPDKAEWRLDVPRLWVSIGTLKKPVDRNGALFALEQAINSARNVAEAATKDDVAYCRCHIAQYLDLVGHLKWDNKDWPGALKAYEEAYAIRSALHKEDPEDNAWEPFVAESLINIANVKLAKGDARSAIGDYEKSRAIMTRLDQEDEWAKMISGNFQQLRQKGISNSYMDRVENEVRGCKQPILNQGSPSTPGRLKR